MDFSNWSFFKHDTIELESILLYLLEKDFLI